MGRAVMFSERLIDLRKFKLEIRESRYLVEPFEIGSD